MFVSYVIISCKETLYIYHNFVHNKVKIRQNSSMSIKIMNLNLQNLNLILSFVNYNIILKISN